MLWVGRWTGWDYEGTWGMALIPAMTVVFDDSETVVIEPKTRDMARAEKAGHDFTEGGQIQGMYALAFATLERLGRMSLLPDGVKVPESAEAFMDCADIELDDTEDPAGG